MNKFLRIEKANICEGQQILVVDPYSVEGSGEYVYVALSDRDGFGAGWLDYYLMFDVPEVVKEPKGVWSEDDYDRLFRFAVWGAGISFIVGLVAAIGGAIGRGL